MSWPTEMRDIGRQDIDTELGRLRAVAEGANEFEWIEDVLGVRRDVSMLRDTLYETFAQWIERRVKSSHGKLVPIRWPRLSEAPDEEEDDPAYGQSKASQWASLG